MNKKSDTILSYIIITSMIILFIAMILLVIQLRARDIKHCLDMGYSYNICIKNA